MPNEYKPAFYMLGPPAFPISNSDLSVQVAGSGLFDPTHLIISEIMSNIIDLLELDLYAGVWNRLPIPNPQVFFEKAFGNS